MTERKKEPFSERDARELRKRLGATNDGQWKERRAEERAQERETKLLLPIVGALALFFLVSRNSST